MALFGGADEIIIGAIELNQHVAEDGRVLVGQLNRLDTFLLGSLLHLLAVFVGARQKEHILAVKPLKPRHNIRGDRRVGVADMRNPVGIENRGGDVKTLGAHDCLRIPCPVPDRHPGLYALSS